jgi:hypothetical protein
MAIFVPAISKEKSAGVKNTEPNVLVFLEG